MCSPAFLVRITATLPYGRIGFALIAGRKLLLADDSLAVQKVIDLTFTDEGMEVATASDGDDAWQKLEQFQPDVVLADVFMPGINGYGLCERIKRNERFGSIPVILLVGSFEPFDEVEARRVGADDVVTKPFQSIRQLVSRVGLLMSGKSDDLPPAVGSTLGLQVPEPVATPKPVEEPQVTVLVEAPTMGTPEAPEKTCQPDIELQTADTQQLPPVEPTDSADFHDTAELINASAVTERVQSNAPNMNAMMNQPAPEMTAVDSSESLLDLDDYRPIETMNDEFILDIDEEPEPRDDVFVAIAADDAPAAIVADSFVVTEIQTDGNLQTPPAETAVAESPAGTSSDLTNLSPNDVDAIARRVVELMSDKVVREITWEVVPELAELLIKQRLDEQKQ